MATENLQSIPKIIHYCWFGPGKMKKLQRRCIKSWKKHLPEFTLMKWDETNVELENPFVKNAYDKRKWAFVADYVRLLKLKEYGGIYLDTDMLMLKPLYPLLGYQCFFGAESPIYINGGIIGSVKEGYFIEECLKEYTKLEDEGREDWSEISIPKIITRVFNKHFPNIKSFNQIVIQEGIAVYPPYYFYPLPYNKRERLKRFKNYVVEDTFTVHLWDSSWIDFDAFYYIRKRDYLKGFSIVGKELLKNENLNYTYFKKVLRSIKYSIFN